MPEEEHEEMKTACRTCLLDKDLTQACPVFATPDQFVIYAESC